MSDFDLWRREDGALLKIQALAYLCGRLCQVAEAAPDMGDDATGPAGRGIPQNVLEPLAALRGAVGLMAEIQQFEDVLSWGLRGPERECPIDRPRFRPQLEEIRRHFVALFLGVESWLGELAQAADRLDAAGRGLVSGHACAGIDRGSELVTLLDLKEGTDAA